MVPTASPERRDQRATTAFRETAAGQDALATLEREVIVGTEANPASRDAGETRARLALQVTWETMGQWVRWDPRVGLEYLVSRAHRADLGRLVYPALWGLPAPPGLQAIPLSFYQSPLVK